MSEDNKQPEQEDVILPNVIDKIEANGCYKEGAVHEIGVFYTFWRVSNIDTAGQTFQAQFELQLTWLPTKEDIKNYEHDKENYKPSFIPKYNWTNAAEIDIEMDEVGYEILTNNGIDTWGNKISLSVPFVNAILYDGKATFVIPNINLSNFPFDSVDLPIELEAQKTIDNVMFVPSFDISNPVIDVTQNCYKLNPEFSIHKPLCEIFVDFDEEQYCTFVVRLKFERYWTSYVNLYITLFSLCLCTLCIFAMDCKDQINDRISNIFTMLLTIVAYQFILESQLPKIPYYTIADIYIFVCFLYILSIAMEVIVVNQIDDDDAAKEWDVFGFWIILTAFLLWNIIYAILVIFKKKNELRKLKWLKRDFLTLGCDEEKYTTVSHRECHFQQKVKRRLGTYWAKHLADKTSDENNEQDENDGHTQIMQLT